jgi:hypothetical protein
VDVFLRFLERSVLLGGCDFSSLKKHLLGKIFLASRGYFLRGCYSGFVKIWLLVAVLVCGLGVAKAQASTPEFGIRLGFNVLLLPGFHLGLEVSDPTGGLGVRVQINPYIFVNRFSAEAYLFVPISPAWDVYFGGGAAAWVGLFAPKSEDFYGIVGVRLKQGFFLEVNPGLTQSFQCVSSAPLTGATRTPVSLPCLEFEFRRNFFIIGTLGFSWRL